MKKLTVVILILLYAGSAWSQTSKDCEPLDVYVRSAKIYTQQRIPDYNQAQKQLSRAIECYPSAVEPQYILAKIQYQKRMYDQFLASAKSIDTLDTAKRYTDSVWQMRRAAWGELFNRGVDSLKASNRVDSLKFAAQQEGNTTAFDSLNNLGRHYLEAAKTLFLFSLEMDSSRSEPYQNLGVLDVRLQNWEDALRWYRQALMTKPGDVDLLRNLVSLNMRLERNDSAMQYLRVLLEQSPDDLEALTNKAAIFAAMGMPDSANMVFEEIITKDPNNKPVLFNLGMTQVQSAQNYMEQEERYIKQANDYSNEYNALAGQGASESKLTAARKRHQDALASWKEVSTHSKESWSHASGMFERLASLDSTDHEAFYYWGLSQFWQKHYDSALVPLERAVALNPGYCDAWQLLTYTYKGVKNEAKATEAQQRFDSCGK